MFFVGIRGDQRLIERFEGMGAEVQAALKPAVKGLAIELQRHVVQDKLSGQVLNQRSGALARSIQEESPIVSGGMVLGRVYSSGDVKYAAIHEYGGVIPAHDVVPVKAKALAFTIGGQQVFAKLVHIPDVTMPERSFLRSSLADESANIIATMREAVVGAVAKTVKG